MTTRDVLKWHFAPFDLLAVSAIALAGFALGCLDWAAARVERWIDEACS